MPTRLLQASAEVFVDEWAGRHQSRSDKSDGASAIPQKPLDRAVTLAIGVISRAAELARLRG